MKSESRQPQPDLYRRAIAVFRINRTFALNDCPAEPVEVLRAGARENQEVLIVFGAPAMVERYLRRARNETDFEQLFETVIEI